MAVADFLRLFRSMPEPERLRALPGLGLNELEILQEAFEQGAVQISWPVEAALVSRLYSNPPRPELASKILLPREMVEIMAIRYAQGQHIEHLSDAIRQPIPDHLARIVHRARNGSPVYDAIQAIDDRALEEVETWRDELLADLAAMRALHGGKINGNGTHCAG